LTDRRRLSTDWRIKCAALHAFGALPLGQNMHYFAQRYVTRRIPRPKASVQDSLAWVSKHVQAFKAHGGNFKEGTYFEFGAGWDLFTNLVLYEYGIEHQLLVDIRPYARMDLVNHAIRQLRDIQVPGQVRTTLTELEGDFTESLLKSYGITYLAPCDARALRVSDGAVDLVSTTNTLEHIPETDIRSILRECARTCNTDSIVSMVIDYSDHYSHSDTTLTPYNYLRFSDAQWRMRNPKIHFQNRLRHSDYIRLFEEAGFSIAEETSFTPTGALDDLERVPLAARFTSYKRDDLAKINGHFVLKKAQEHKPH
jgi:hypothetical protein